MNSGNEAVSFDILVSRRYGKEFSRRNWLLRLLNVSDIFIEKALSLTAVIATCVILLLAVLVFALVLSRYILRINVPGLFDGATYTLVIFPFLTAAYTLRKGKHISVDVLTNVLSERVQLLLGIPVYLTSAVFVTVLGWQAFRWWRNLVKFNALTDASFRIPKSILVSIMIFGCFLLLLQIIREITYKIVAFSSESSSGRVYENPWVYVSAYVTGLAISLFLFAYVNPVVGLIIFLIVALFSGMPVFLALGITGCVGLFYAIGPQSLIQIPMTSFESVNSFTMSCLPLFVLGGLIIEGSGIAEDLFRFFEVWMGWFATSTLLITIILGMIFCAMSGSTTATTAVVAGVAIPVLVKRGFRKDLACGAVAGATVGTLIPPSIGYVVYGVLTGESVGALFIGGLLPALLLFAFYFLYVIIRGLFGHKYIFEKGIDPAKNIRGRSTWKERFSSLKTALWGLAAPVVILGGIYAGIYTPTESAGVLVVYAIFVAVFIKGVKWKSIIQSALRGAVTSSMIICIIFCAYIFALVISQLQLAPKLADYLAELGVTAGALVGILFVVLLILGLFLESSSLKVLTLPIIYPLAMALGINSLWLGIFYQFNGEIGLLTPPVGLNLFVISGITGISLTTIVRGTIPFVLMMMLTLLIIYFYPELVTWLPSTRG